MTYNIIPDHANKAFDNGNNDINDNFSPVDHDDNYNTNFDSEKEALYYKSQGFNVTAIPKPGEKVGQIYDDNLQKFVDEIADGKSAKGCGSWSKLQHEGQTVENVTESFQNKSSNIAIITGKASKIVAFDIDGDEAERKFDEVIKNLDDIQIKSALDKTMQSKTGSGHGKHIIIGFNPEEFQNDESIKTTTLWTGNGKHSEIKLKGEGGYIVVPPSLHISASLVGAITAPSTQSAFAYVKKDNRKGNGNGNTVTIEECKNKGSASGFDTTLDQECENLICTHPGNNATCTQEGLAAAAVQQGNQTTPVKLTCEECFRKFLNADQISQLLSIGNKDTLEEVCDILHIGTQSDFQALFEFISGSHDIAVQIIQCLLDDGIVFGTRT